MPEQWPKNVEVMAKKRMPLYGIIGIFWKFLTHNLAKSQYFSMGPSLFDYYYQITYYLQVLANYLKLCGFYIQKIVKISQNQPYPCLCFLSNRGRLKIITLHFSIFSLEILNDFWDQKSFNLKKACLRLTLQNFIEVLCQSFRGFKINQSMDLKISLGPIRT